MKNRFNEILLRAKHLLLRFPMILTMALLASVGAILMSENPNWKYQNFAYSKFTIVCCLGISVMFALKMISQRIGKEILLQILGVVFLIGFLLFLPEKQEYFTENYVYLIVSIFILSHLLVAFGAFLRSRKEIGFWQYNKNLFVNLFLTIVFTGVLTAGVELAILAVDKLFDLNINSRIYQETFYFLLIFGSCFIFLLFNESGLQHLEKDGNYPLILKFFTQFILIPLLLIYLLILYFYCIKIIINWELPRGWVSYLVLAYSVVGILALLLVHPLKADSAKSWVKGFSKIFYYTLLPLLVLLYVAIFTRILQYGFTEPRYFVLLIAIWLTSVVLYFIFSKKSDIRFIPVSLFAFGLIALILPYYNAFSVAKRSQKKELLQTLEKNHLLRNRKIDFDQKLDYKTAIDIRDKFEFLTQRKEFDFLLNLMDAPKQKELKKEFAMMNYWKAGNLVKGYFPNIINNQNINNYLELYSLQTVIPVKDYQYIANLRKLSPAFQNNYETKEMILQKDKIIITDKMYQENPMFLVALNSGEQKNLMPEIIHFFENYKNQTGRHEMQEISIVTQLGKYSIKFYFDSISKNGELYYYNDALVLVKE